MNIDVHEEFAKLAEEIARKTGLRVNDVWFNWPEDGTKCEAVCIDSKKKRRVLD